MDKKELEYYLGIDFYHEETRVNRSVQSSFTLYDRLNNIFEVLPKEKDIDHWLSKIITDFIHRCTDLTEKDEIIEQTINKLYKIASEPCYGVPSSKHIWNQEFPDVIYKIFISVLESRQIAYKEYLHDFNELAFEFIPVIIDNRVDVSYIGIEELLKLSIVSGLSGLDLKGTTAAASELNNTGIPMLGYSNRKISDEMVDSYFNSLLLHSGTEHPIFHFESFLHDLSNSRSVIWFTDDIIESYFDLLLIQKILTDYPRLSLCIVPKNGNFGNDLSWKQLLRILNSDFFGPLRSFTSSGRFSWSQHGPSMAALNLYKISQELKNLIEKSDFAFVKGCRMSEMINGNFPIRSYTCFNVVRIYTEIISGFSAKNTPLLFIKSEANEAMYEDIYCIEDGTLRISENRRTIKDIVLGRE